MSIKVAINGFGRIGRSAFRAASRQEQVEIVAVNDLTDAKTNAHLLKYDSVYGVYPGQIAAGDGYLEVDGRQIKVCAEKDPAALPWGELGVDLVIEATGKFRDRDKAAGHLAAGAKKVIISAPGKNEDLTVVMGVNQDEYDPKKHHVLSNASCTTNCLAPVAKVLNDEFGIVKGLMTTVHSITNDQQILDIAHKDLRRARASSMSIIPTSTGAAKAISRVIPALHGKLNGFAMRVPTPTVSVVDLVVDLEKSVTAESINAAFRAAAAGPMRGVLAVSDEELVSVDYRGNTASATVDALSTMVLGENMAKVIAWYDNEWAYACRLIDLAAYIAAKGL